MKDKKKNCNGTIALVAIGIGVAAGATIIFGLKHILNKIDPKDDFLDGEWISDNDL